MATATGHGRQNQKYRARKDLLDAAARLMKHGQRPTMEEVAEEARVSRATAYRYFPKIEALLIEAPLDIAVPDADTLFVDDTSADPVTRVDKAEAALHRMVWANEAQLRLMLAHSLVAKAEGLPKNGTPTRQNRRTPLIEAALAPARDRFDAVGYDRLCAALALVFGTESMIVFKDVLQLDEKVARNVKSWAVRALVRAALEQPDSSS